jgi:hypothetical protein
VARRIVSLRGLATKSAVEPACSRPPRTSRPTPSRHKQTPSSPRSPSSAAAGPARPAAATSTATAASAAPPLPPSPVLASLTLKQFQSQAAQAIGGISRLFDAGTGPAPYNPGSLDPTLNRTGTALFIQPPIRKGASRRLLSHADLHTLASITRSGHAKAASQDRIWRQFLTGEHVKMGKESLLDRVVKLAVMQCRIEN